MYFKVWLVNSALNSRIPDGLAQQGVAQASPISMQLFPCLLCLIILGYSCSGLSFSPGQSITRSERGVKVLGVGWVEE